MEPVGTKNKKGLEFVMHTKSRPFRARPLTFTGICDKIMEYFEAEQLHPYELNNCVLMNLINTL